MPPEDGDKTTFDIRMSKKKQEGSDTPPRGVVDARVSTESGSPLGGVEITVDVNGHSFVGTAKTGDSLGRGKIPNVPMTEKGATVTFRKNGMKTETYQVGPGGDVNWGGEQAYTQQDDK